MKIRYAKKFARLPGFYDLPNIRYWRDPCLAPSLNVGTIKELLTKTPRHAWLQHPRLNKRLVIDPGSRVQDLGSAVHELLSGKGRGIVVIDADSYRSNDAKAKRDEAVEAGNLPVLGKDMDRATAIADSVRAKISRTPDMRGAFAGNKGHGEVVAVWQDRAGCWGRTMIDWYGPKNIDIWDLKTTTAGLDDEAIAAKIQRDQLDVQEAWIRRALEHIDPEVERRLRVRFVIVEQDEPFEARVIELPLDTVRMGKRKVHVAAHLFSRCLANGTRQWAWPGYPDRIEGHGPREWYAREWEAREPHFHSSVGEFLMDLHDGGAPVPRLRAIGPGDWDIAADPDPKVNLFG